MDLEAAGFRPVVVNVPPEKRKDEQLGSKSKFWFTLPEAESWLFKRGRVNEDWSEKVAAELAGHLGLPHAKVELATCDGQPGVISQSFLQKGDRLVHGNELLFELDTRYPMTGRFHTSQHTVEAIAGALDRFQVGAWSERPDGLPGSFDGLDLFLGYLLFDAWIGNSDRHHENWAIVQRGEQRLLAPTYDHGSSMGRNETEERVKVRLEGTDPRVTVGAYASKCRSALFEPSSPSRPMLTVDTFLHAAHRRPHARDYWLSQLEATDKDFVRGTLQRIPDTRISTSYRKFAYEIIMFNLGRLMAARTRIGNG
jgi:hypothetical protein